MEIRYNIRVLETESVVSGELSSMEIILIGKKSKTQSSGFRRT